MKRAAVTTKVTNRNKECILKEELLTKMTYIKGKNEEGKDFRTTLPRGNSKT